MQKLLAAIKVARSFHAIFDPVFIESLATSSRLQKAVPIAVFPLLFPSGSERFTAILANERWALDPFLRAVDKGANRAAGNI